MPTEQDIQSNLERLTGQTTASSEGIPGVTVVEVDGTQSEMSPETVAAYGLGMSQQYMSRNGPIQSQHVRRRTVMTKAQYEEQKMNEKMGYPSNLDEAGRVKQLESDMAGMQQGIQAILSRLSGGTTVFPPQTNSPTPQNPSLIPSSPVLSPQLRLVQQSVPQMSQGEAPTPSQSGSDDSTSTGKRLVKLSNGKVVEIPATQPSPLPTPPRGNLSVGPEESMALVEPTSDEDFSDLWVEETPVPEFKNDPKLERLAFMVAEASTFLRNRDPHLFFRRVLPRTVSRQVGFSAWPKVLQERFNVHFRTLLTDPVFLRGQVATALSFEFGHGLSPQKVAELISLSAGFMAFSLAGAEVNS
jgi:hypothetical protein